MTSLPTAIPNTHTRHTHTHMHTDTHTHPFLNISLQAFIYVTQTQRHHATREVLAVPVSVVSEAVSECVNYTAIMHAQMPACWRPGSLRDRTQGNRAFV